jgi:hypothetical protein
MPRLKRLLRFGRPPFVNFHGQVNILWVASCALARLDGRFDALQRPRRMLPRAALVRPAKRRTERELKPPALDHPSLLRRPTTVALKQGSRISHISCFMHDPRYALPWSSRFVLFSMESLKGSHRFSVACPESRLGPSVFGEVLRF